MTKSENRVSCLSYRQEAPLCVPKYNINGRLGFTDDTASILDFHQYMLVGWLWLEFRYHLFQLDDLFGQITYRFGQLIKCYFFFLHTSLVFNRSMAKKTGALMVELFTKI